MVGLILFGIVMMLVGASSLWLGFGGRDWASTHDRSFDKIDRISLRQEKINTIAAWVLGVFMILIGIGTIAVAVTL